MIFQIICVKKQFKIETQISACMKLIELKLKTENLPFGFELFFAGRENSSFVILNPNRAKMISFSH